MEVVPITTQKTEALDDVRRVLQSMMDLGDAGELTGIVIVATTAEDGISTAFSKALNRHLLISGIELVKHRMIAGMTDK